jgi:hypothetical protein
MSRTITARRFGTDVSNIPKEVLFTTPKKTNKVVSDEVKPKFRSTPAKESSSKTKEQIVHVTILLFLHVKL